MTTATSEGRDTDPETRSFRRARRRGSLLRPFTTAAVAPVIGIVLAIILIQVHGFQALPTIGIGFQYALGSFESLARTIAAALPLYLGAVGVTIAFRAGMFTLGAQGQLYAGALTGAIVGATIGPMLAPVHQAIALIAAGVVGAALSAVFGWLRARWDVNEVLSTLLANYIILLLCTLIADGPFHDPNAQAVGATVAVQPSAMFTNLVPRTQLTTAIFPIAVLCLVAWWIVERSAIGYRWRMIGESPGFARAVGMNVASGRIWAMAASGALCGVAGALLVLAGTGRFIAGIGPELGWTVIMLALIARSRPAFAVLWTTVYAIMQSASRGIQQTTGVPTELAMIVICGILAASSAAPEVSRLIFTGLARLRSGRSTP